MQVLTIISRFLIFLVILTSPNGKFIDFFPATLNSSLKNLFDVGIYKLFWGQDRLEFAISEANK